MSTLAEITGIERDDLTKKFQLEPLFCSDPNRIKNVAFMSPLVLLKDSELKPGGYQDRGPKKTLGRIAKDILLEPNGHMFFQVPEVTYLHLGYAKISANKKGKMAINEVEAKVWKSFLNMSRFTRSTSPSESTFEEEALNTVFPFPAQALEVVSTDAGCSSNPGIIRPFESGLKTIVKGRYLLLFSILLIFFNKKKGKKRKREEGSTTNEDKIEVNKVSDFLLFWILPHLLNFNQRKVHEMIQHHRSKEGEFHNFVEKSASDIIKEAFKSSELSDDLQDFIEKKYRDCYGEKMDTKYKLLKTEDGSPIIVVPKNYQVDQMPAALEDFTTWCGIHNDTLLDDFMKKFIKHPEIQRDFFASLQDLKHRQGIEYAIILPDEDTYLGLLRRVRDASAQILSQVKFRGRKLIVPQMAVVTGTNKHLTVCFSYFQGSDRRTVAALFRAIGAHYLDHFTLALFHGVCLEVGDPKWELKVGSLYPIKSARKIKFTQYSLNMKQMKEMKPLDFSEAQGRFCRAEFPETYESFEQAIREDPLNIEDIISRANSKTQEDVPSTPKFERDEEFTTGYSIACKVQKLLNIPSTVGKRLMKKFNMKAVNLNGCLLSRLANCGRRSNIGVVLAVNDSLDKNGCLMVPNLKDAIRRIITYFVQAVIVAGLPEVYPSEPDEENREDIECSTSEDDGDDEDDDDDDDNMEQMLAADEAASASAIVASRLPATSYSATERPSMLQAGTIKEGTFTDDKLLDLARDVITFWKNFGRELQIPEARLDEIDIDYQGQGVVEKAYQMLLSWKDKCYPSTTFRCMYDVLSNQRLNRGYLAIKHCCLQNSI